MTPRLTLCDFETVWLVSNGILTSSLGFVQRLQKAQDTTDIFGDGHEIVEEIGSDTGKQLWVDKYGPKRFTDLIGDEVGC